jgi:hypothetical protein
LLIAKIYEILGGGQLAHTILGVDYNVRSGACEWLVLDPHYAGYRINHWKPLKNRNAEKRKKTKMVKAIGYFSFNF